MNRSGSLLKSAVVLALPLLSGSLWAAPIPHTADANSIVLYHFDETAGGTVADGNADFLNAAGATLNGKGYDIASDQIVLGATGVFDKALQLKGGALSPVKRNAAVALGVTPTTFEGGPFTLEAWIKDPYLTGASTTQGRIIAQSRDSAITWSFGLKSNGSMAAMGNASGGSFSVGTSALTWTSDTWYYVALTADTTGQAEGMALYTFYRMELGGTALSSLGSYVGNAPVNPGTSGFTVGGHTSASSTTFAGYIDEVHYSNIARDFEYLTIAAIPEPSSCVLLVGSLGMAAWAARRRSR